MYAKRLGEALPEVRERIAAAAARRGGTTPVTLVAVTKSHPLAAVEAAWEVGLADVGENRVQELAEKRAALAGAAAERGLRWHLIGHLQRNKVKRALEAMDLIHSVDSERLARELATEASRAGQVIRALVQVNVSGEETKGGFEGPDAVAMIARVCALPGLRVEGLMTMAPYTDDERVLRATFGAARALLEQCVAGAPGLAGRELSMGMSNDYEIAIEEGSTMVRLGTVLFGERTR